MRFILFATISAAISACSTTAVSLRDATQVPSSRVTRYATPKPNTAKLIVIRDSGFVNGGCYMGLYVNGVLSARLATSEKVTLYVDQGEILIGAGNDTYARGPCSFAPNQITSRETILKAGEVKIFRIKIDQDGNFDILRHQM